MSEVNVETTDLTAAEVEKEAILLHFKGSSIGQQASPIYIGDLGRGYDSVRLEKKIPAMKDIKTKTTGGSGKMDFVVEYDYKTIYEKLGVNTKMNIEASGTSVDLSVDFNRTINSKEMGVYVLFRMPVITEIESITGGSISDTAAQLKGKTLKEVYNGIGNRVITSITKGGELFFILKFHSRSHEESIKIKSHLNVTSDIFFDKTEFDTKVNYVKTQVNKNMKFETFVHWMGGEVDPMKLLDPSKSSAEINAWKNSLKTKPAVISFMASSLNEVDLTFGAVTEHCIPFEKHGLTLRSLEEKNQESLVLVKQYISTRESLLLPATTAATTFRSTGEALEVKITNEETKLFSKVFDGYTFPDSLVTEVKNWRKDTPVFTCDNVKSTSDWMGYGNSGMPTFDWGNDVNDVKYIQFMTVANDRTVNGIRAFYRDYNDNLHERHLAQIQGHPSDIKLEEERDVLNRVKHWGKQRSEWWSVGGLEFYTLRGKKYGPYSYDGDGKAPDNDFTGGGEAGSERYIIGFWGSGGAYWLQKLGLYYRQCRTLYPYKNE